MGFDMTLENLTELLEGASPEAYARLMSSTAQVRSQLWSPQAGPQSVAYYHMADEMLYGGAAGGGKTDLVIGLATTAHRRSLVFRRMSTDLDGLWDRLMDVTSGHTVQSNNVKKRMTLKDGRVIEGGHLEAPNSEKSWQGRPHDLIGFDEAAQLDEHKVNFVTQWLRSVDANQHCRVVFATNPPLPEFVKGKMVDSGSGEWLKRWFAPWINPQYGNPAQSGEIRWCYMKANGDRLETVWVPNDGYYDIETGEQADPTPAQIKAGKYAKAKSRTFVKSLLDDNKYLADTGYGDKLSSTPEPLRSMLRNGQFGIKLADHTMQVIPTNWVLQAQERWNERNERNDPPAPMLVLAADIAQGGIDSTVTVALRDDAFFDTPDIYAGVETPTGEEVVERLLARRKNNALIVLDGTGGWGGSTRDLLKTHHEITAMMCNSSEASTAWTKDMVYKFLNMRSDLWWMMREALDPDSGEKVMLPPSDALLAQLTAPHWALNGRCIQIESKDDLRKRLGTSTDEADAVIMAWHYRKRAVLILEQALNEKLSYGGREAQSRHKSNQSTEMADPLEDWGL